MCHLCGGISHASRFALQSLKRLAMLEPTGAIVSLHELPDAIRFVAEGTRAPRA